jgi:hypothetical protein
MRLTDIFRSKTENSPNINQDEQGKSILPITAISTRHAIIESPSIGWKIFSPQMRMIMIKSEQFKAEHLLLSDRTSCLGAVQWWPQFLLACWLQTSVTTRVSCRRYWCSDRNSSWRRYSCLTTSTSCCPSSHSRWPQYTGSSCFVLFFYSCM